MSFVTGLFSIVSCDIQRDKVLVTGLARVKSQGIDQAQVMTRPIARLRLQLLLGLLALA